ncbi:hypothetical protein HZH68_012749 [Vespula germanica]|uniref:Uncharacterized protein n=1 Tax=Vespula germanica TaxID=30212 RepID=A0A834JH63_VESGE|nr:hypothetical protein HZH68_012749 [Vespula germanica]
MSSLGNNRLDDRDESNLTKHGSVIIYKGKTIDATNNDEDDEDDEDSLPERSEKSVAPDRNFLRRTDRSLREQKLIWRSNEDSSGQCSSSSTSTSDSSSSSSNNSNSSSNSSSSILATILDLILVR